MRGSASVHTERRHRMVRHQIHARGVRDPRILRAMRTVPREVFVPARLRELAYGDQPLPIGEGQTISQPFVVAYMAQALELRPVDRVLEIGTGSGYAAAVLGRIAREVFTVERFSSLARRARRRLARLGYRNVQVTEGDGSLGWPENAPYDAIVATAGGPRVPAPLLEQLAPGGRLVMPVGPEPTIQRLHRVRRLASGASSFRSEELLDVRFVPLIGAGGWPEEAARGAPALPGSNVEDGETGPR